MLGELGEPLGKLSELLDELGEPLGELGELLCELGETIGCENSRHLPRRDQHSGANTWTVQPPPTVLSSRVHLKYFLNSIGFRLF